VDFGFEFLLLVGEEVDLDVRIGCSAHVERGQLLGLVDSHDQIALVEIVFQLVLQPAQFLLLFLLAFDGNVFHVVGQFVHVRLNLRANAGASSTARR